MLKAELSVQPSLSKALALTVALAAAAALLCGKGAWPYTPAAETTHVRPSGNYRPRKMAGLPHVMLWAWERPEDLRFINPRRVGVAFLAQTVYLRAGEVVVRPRLQLLRVPEGTPLVAVARIESGAFSRSFDSPALLSPALSDTQRAQAVAAVAELQHIPGVVAIQIDFDATTSERAFYGELLRNLRQRLPDSLPLSITALASWCLSDSWLDALPVDEAVPMLFRMGPDGREVRLHLAAGEDLRGRACGQSVPEFERVSAIRSPPPRCHGLRG